MHNPGIVGLHVQSAPGGPGVQILELRIPGALLQD